MAEPHTSPTFISRRTSQPDLRTVDPDDQIAAIEQHLSTIEGMQRADHAALTTLIDTIGSSPDAATGAEGKGMRKQTAEVQKQTAEVREMVKGLTEGGGSTRGMPPRGSLAGSVGAVIGGVMATCVVVLEILKTFGVVK
jgi:hypothetical protein